MMKKYQLKTRLLILILLCFMQFAHAHQGEHKHEHKNHKPTVKKLLNSELSNIPGLEVIVSEVDIPPNTSLAKHWHPGDEFGYVIKGTVLHWQKDAKPKLVKAGEAVQIPLGQIHTAITQHEGATVLVFRIHPLGQPERVIVEK